MVAPHIRPAKRGGRPRTANVREVVNAILYLLGTGCQWRALPKDFPPRSTVFGDLDLWGWDGTSIMRSLGRCASRPARRPALRPRSSTAKASRACPCGGRGGRKRGAQIDPSGGACPRARQSRDPWDAGKTVKGKKRHILVDTLGLVIAVLVHPADVQDREGGLRLLQSVRRTFPFIKRIFADAAYRGEATAAAVRALGQWQIEIVKRADRAQGFRPLRKRWIVERTLPGSAAAGVVPRILKTAPAWLLPTFASP
ncbi:MAG: IS5 family transposase [Stellaceae bacterium]